MRCDDNDSAGARKHLQLVPTTIAISDGPEKEEERKEKMGYASCSRDKLVSFAGFASVVDFYIRKNLSFILLPEAYQVRTVRATVYSTYVPTFTYLHTISNHHLRTLREVG